MHLRVKAFPRFKMSISEACTFDVSSFHHRWTEIRRTEIAHWGNQVVYILSGNVGKSGLWENDGERILEGRLVDGRESFQG